jgi:HAD superfamily hydrolase (TIGR01484 family)
MNNKIYLFDLDGTLAESKGPVDDQMIPAFKNLIRYRKVCVISGGRMQQFEEQLLDRLDIDPEYQSCLNNLHLFPTSGAAYWNWDGESWNRQYNHALTPKEKIRIKLALLDLEPLVDDPQALADETSKTHNPTMAWGDTIEDRGTQITLSALGQQAPYEEKKKWDPDRRIRKLWKLQLEKTLGDEFEIRIGGSTSIDVTKPGIHKGFAVKKICEIFDCTVKDLIFFGDALEPGGNDHEVYKAGVWSIPVDDHVDCLAKLRLHFRLGI